MANNEMGFGRSPLKFRHIYGEPAKKEFWYENIPTSKNAHDGRFIAANSSLLAIATESTGGGSFIVIPQTRTGRITGMNLPKVCGHSGPILDLAWNPFNDSIIASASDDATVKLWRVDPENGLSADLTAAEVELHGHRRRAIYIDWHPSASDVLMSAGYDHQIILWNVERRIPFQTITGQTQQIHSIAWHPEGRLMACTNKDKTLRVMDPRSGVVVMSAQGAHSGPKASKTLFLDDTHLLSVGFGRHSDREYAVWTLDNNLTSPIQRQMIDQSSGVILPHYDPDCKVVYLVGKGDGNVRFYEFAERNVHYLSQHITSVPQRGVGLMPKRCLNMERCEIFRLFKQHVTSNVVEPISIIAPRRGPYRDDLYPPTQAPVSALTAEQWCYHGLNRGPVMMNRVDGSLINPPLPASQSVSTSAVQQRPAIPQSILNIGCLTTTEKEEATVPNPSSLAHPAAREPHTVPVNGHHSSQQPRRQEPVMRSHDRRMLEPQSDTSRRRSTGIGMVVESPRDDRELSAPPTAPGDVEDEDELVDKVANFRTLIQSFEKNTGQVEPAAPGANSFIRNRRAQSMRERRSRPMTTDLNNLVISESNNVSISSRPRFIRRPESLQSPEEQRRSIELSLHNRVNHSQLAEGTAEDGSQQLLSASLEQLALPSVRDLILRRELGDERSLSMPTTPGTSTTSTRVIEMKTRSSDQPPETYEGLQEAFFEHQKEIKRLQRELEQKDHEIECLRSKLSQSGQMSLAANRGSKVDSSFC